MTIRRYCQFFRIENLKKGVEQDSRHVVCILLENWIVMISLPF